MTLDNVMWIVSALYIGGLVLMLYTKRGRRILNRLIIKDEKEG